MDKTDLIYELKDIDSMTLQEIKREYNFQNWLLRTYKRIWSPTNYHYHEAVERNKKENMTTLGEDYMNGIITEEEYKSKQGIRATHRELNLQREREWARRLFWLECQIKEQEGIVYELLDKIEEGNFEKGLPKKSEYRIPKPLNTVFYHGYDPRRKTTATNYNKKYGNIVRMKELEKAIAKLQAELDRLRAAAENSEEDGDGDKQGTLPI